MADIIYNLHLKEHIPGYVPQEWANANGTLDPWESQLVYVLERKRHWRKAFIWLIVLAVMTRLDAYAMDNWLIAPIVLISLLVMLALAAFCCYAWAFVRAKPPAMWAAYSRDVTEFMNVFGLTSFDAYPVLNILSNFIEEELHRCAGVEKKNRAQHAIALKMGLAGKANRFHYLLAPREDAVPASPSSA